MDIGLRGRQATLETWIVDDAARIAKIMPAQG
jgi:adenylate cyclase